MVAGHVELFRRGRHDAPAVAPLAALLPHLKRQLVLRHGHQQLEQIGSVLEVVLAGRRAHKEAFKDGLADVHRVKDPVHAGVVEPQPHLAADDWLVLPDEVHGRLFVPGADAVKENGEGGFFGHEGTRPGAGCQSGLHLYSRRGRKSRKTSRRRVLFARKWQ